MFPCSCLYTYLAKACLHNCLLLFICSEWIERRYWEWNYPVLMHYVWNTSRMKETWEYFEKVSLLYKDLSATKYHSGIYTVTLNPTDICEHIKIIYLLNFLKYNVPH